MSEIYEGIPRLLPRPKVHCRVHKNLPLDPILWQMNPVHNPSPYFFTMYHHRPIYVWVSWMISSLQVFRLKLYTYL